MPSIFFHFYTFASLKSYQTLLCKQISTRLNQVAIFLGYIDRVVETDRRIPPCQSPPYDGGGPKYGLMGDRPVLLRLKPVGLGLIYAIAYTYHSLMHHLFITCINSLLINLGLCQSIQSLVIYENK